MIVWLARSPAAHAGRRPGPAGWRDLVVSLAGRRVTADRIDDEHVGYRRLHLQTARPGAMAGPPEW